MAMTDRRIAPVSAASTPGAESAGSDRARGRRARIAAGAALAAVAIGGNVFDLRLTR